MLAFKSVMHVACILARFSYTLSVFNDGVEGRFGPVCQELVGSVVSRDSQREQGAGIASWPIILVAEPRIQIDNARTYNSTHTRGCN